MGAFKKRKRKEENFIISREVAEEQLFGWLDYYDLEYDNLLDEARQLCDRYCENLIAGVRKGKLTLNADGTIKHQLEGKTKVEVTYQALSGKAKTQGSKTSIEGSDETRQTRRMYAIMASLANLDENKIEEFHAIDMAYVEAIAFLYLNV
jgi:hypothetical protein